MSTLSPPLKHTHIHVPSLPSEQCWLGWLLAYPHWSHPGWFGRPHSQWTAGRAECWNLGWLTFIKEHYRPLAIPHILPSLRIKQYYENPILGTSFITHFKVHCKAALGNMKTFLLVANCNPSFPSLWPMHHTVTKHVSFVPIQVNQLTPFTNGTL